MKTYGGPVLIFRMQTVQEEVLSTQLDSKVPVVDDDSTDPEELTRVISLVLSTEHRSKMLERVESMRKDYDKKMKRKATIEEILRTEETYLSSIKRVIDEVLVPARTSNLLYDDDLHSVFSVLENLYTINRELRSRLEEAVLKVYRNEDEKDEKLMIGSIFLEMAPYFKSYSQYCDNYDRSMKTTTLLSRTNQAWVELLESLRLHPEGKGLSLVMYLIMPVQRIPRYLLLLSSLCEYTDPRHEDYPNICNAISAIKSVAESVNASVKNAENRAHVISISQQLINFNEGFELIEPHRLHIRTGLLYKVNSIDRSVSTRVVHLFNDLLLTAIPMITLNVHKVGVCVCACVCAGVCVCVSLSS
eukprot:TRINITY_DN1792_c2_g2_i1.p1 TRINITY_DN1792_c2_g2~~TRINITY_DN1792_c2_g2_i1.p1  ORF type:complete len:360 (+),score=50.44 TRINITY_DN1792_c2_g2_i1:60-1139(+)